MFRISFADFLIMSIYLRVKCMMLQDGSSTFSFFSMGASYSLDESRIEGVSGDSPDDDK